METDGDFTVPVEWEGCEYEYKLGWADGMNHPKAWSGRWNPVHYTGVDANRRRKAWYAGRRDALRHVRSG